MQRYSVEPVYIGTGDYVAELVPDDDGEAVLYDDAMAQIERLRDALNLFVGINCAQLHHAPVDRHRFDEPCPVVARINAALRGEE